MFAVRGHRVYEDINLIGEPSKYTHLMGLRFVQVQALHCRITDHITFEDNVMRQARTFLPTIYKSQFRSRTIGKWLVSYSTSSTFTWKIKVSTRLPTFPQLSCLFSQRKTIFFQHVLLIIVDPKGNTIRQIAIYIADKTVFLLVLFYLCITLMESNFQRT